MGRDVCEARVPCGFPDTQGSFADTGLHVAHFSFPMPKQTPPAAVHGRRLRLSELSFEEECVVCGLFACSTPASSRARAPPSRVSAPVPGFRPETSMQSVSDAPSNPVSSAPCALSSTPWNAGLEESKLRCRQSCSWPASSPFPSAGSSLPDGGRVRARAAFLASGTLKVPLNVRIVSADLGEPGTTGRPPLSERDLQRWCNASNASCHKTDSRRRDMGASSSRHIFAVS